MKKLVLFISDKDQNQSIGDLADRVKDSIRLSDNFIAHHKLEYTEAEELPTVKLDHDSQDIHICCPSCNEGESLPIDQQRHHLQLFNINAWVDLNEGNERSLMTCTNCTEEFVQLWNYKEEEELEPIEWEYYLESNTAWLEGSNSDSGVVTAKTEEEALNLAKKAVQGSIDKINKQLEPLNTTVNIDLDSVVVQQS